MYGKTPVAITSQPVMLEDPVEKRDGNDGDTDGVERRLPTQHIHNNPREISDVQHQSGFPLSTELHPTPAKMTSSSASSKGEDAADVDRIATVFDDLNGYLSDTATTSLDYKIQTERRRRKKREKTAAEAERSLPHPPATAVVPAPAPRGDSSRLRVRELQGISGPGGGEERSASSLLRFGGGGRATDLQTIPEAGELSAAKTGYFSLPRPASAMARPFRNTPQQPPQPLVRSSSFLQESEITNSIPLDPKIYELQ